LQLSRWGITKIILARAIAGKEDGKTLWEKMTEEKKERVDVGLPLGICILARVNLDLTQYYLAEGKLAMPTPSVKGTIVEIGTIKHRDGLTDYLARISPDDAVEGGNMTLLLIETQNEAVLSTKLFTQKAEIYPVNEEDWAIWLKILGGENLESPDGIVYERLWGDGDENVEPMKASENVLADRYGENVQTNSLLQMMFARQVFDDAGNKLTDEYALVSVVNDTCVEILLGVPINITPEQIMGA
jgi:hypothetical protein